MMMIKFAQLNFKKPKDKPDKDTIISKAAGALQNWYIDRYNPYTQEDRILLNKEGYEVGLPFTAEEAMENEKRILSLTERTLGALEDQGVGIIIPPEDYTFDFPNRIPIAEGRKLFPFFMLPAVEKALKLKGKALKDAEIFIVCQDKDLAFLILDQLYPHVNHLSLLVDDPEEDVYQSWMRHIFSETGLNINIYEKNKSRLTTADVIINTCTPRPAADHAYKREAIYFELGKDKAGAVELARKREDIMVTDGLILKSGGESVFLPQAEAVLYTKSRAYQSLLRRGFDPETAEQAGKELEDLALKPYRLRFTIPRTRDQIAPRAN